MTVTLAIIGRPNVGKSTLFNRLAGKRLAIVEDRPGVTRDRRFAPGSLADLEFQLIDTAGFEDETGTTLPARMRAQTEAAIDEADICLFVMDARTGVTGLDEQFAAILRKKNKPIILLANKSEGKGGDDGRMEAYSLGFGDPLGISAEHGEGLTELYQALRAHWPEDDIPKEEGEVPPLRMAIVGRPNAGKSTLINTLLQQERLVTGPEAGITRDAVAVNWVYEDREIRLVDTAGMRKRAKIDDPLEKMSVADSLRAIRLAEVVVVLLDATHPFEDQDLSIIDLCEREGRAVVVVLSKWDLVDEPQAMLAEYKKRFTELLPQVKGAELVALSAQTGWGLDRLMPSVLEAYRQWNARVKTPDLNVWLQTAIDRHPAPVVNGRRIRPKYISQTKTRPPTFILMASKADRLPDSYRRYLINGIRDTFDIWGTPIRLWVRGGKNPYADKADQRKR